MFHKKWFEMTTEIAKALLKNTEPVNS